jgi:hypothetical protein
MLDWQQGKDIIKLAVLKFTFPTCMQSFINCVTINITNPLQSASRDHKTPLKLVLITNLVQQKQKRQ